MAAPWQDGEWHKATEQHIQTKWAVISTDGRFKCVLCGHVFKSGHLFRFVYMNGESPSPGNFIVCDECGMPGSAQDMANDVRAAMLEYPDLESWQGAYWRFRWYHEAYN